MFMPFLKNCFETIFPFSQSGKNHRLNNIAKMCNKSIGLSLEELFQL